MAFFDKLNDIAKNIGEKTSDAIETTKLTAKISGEKSAIADLTKKIGEHYCAGRAAGTLALEPEAEALYAQIVEHEQVIADTQAEIKRIKEEDAAPAPAAAEPAPAAGPFCPQCGASIAAGARFCGSCGAKME